MSRIYKKSNSDALTGIAFGGGGGSGRSSKSRAAARKKAAAVAPKYKKYDKAIGSALVGAAATAASLTVPGRVASAVASGSIAVAAAVGSNWPKD